MASHLDGQPFPETDAGQHRGAVAGRLNRRFNHLPILFQAQRVHLPEATGGDERAHRELRHVGDVGPQTVDVQREVLTERGYREGDGADELLAELLGIHHGPALLEDFGGDRPAGTSRGKPGSPS